MDLRKQLYFWGEVLYLDAVHFGGLVSEGECGLEVRARGFPGRDEVRDDANEVVQLTALAPEELFDARKSDRILDSHFENCSV